MWVMLMMMVKMMGCSLGKPSLGLPNIAQRPAAQSRVCGPNGPGHGINSRP